MNNEKINNEQQNLGTSTDGNASFMAYISTQNNTQDIVHKWEIEITQNDGNWTGSISYKDPHKVLEAPMSGSFTIKVSAENASTNPPMMQEIAPAFPGGDSITNQKNEAMILIAGNGKKLIGGINADYRVIRVS